MSTSIMLEEAGASRRRSPTAWLCMLMARGLSRLPPATLCAALSAVGHRTRRSHADEALRIRSLVCASSTRVSGMECLERSIAVFLMCRLRGHCPVWCTGFRVDPFAAHAWVEADGGPVGEPPEIASYTKATTVDPVRKPGA